MARDRSPLNVLTPVGASSGAVARPRRKLGRIGRTPKPAESVARDAADEHTVYLAGMLSLLVRASGK